MRFESGAETEADPKTVFAALTDTGAIEAAARRRGMVVRRLHPGSALADGRWQLRLRFRGHARDVDLHIAEADPPSQLGVLALSGGIEARLRLATAPMHGDRTRVTATLDLAARTLAGRLLLGTLAAARGSLARQIDARLDAFARDLDRRAGAAQAHPRLHSSLR